MAKKNTSTAKPRAKTTGLNQADATATIADIIKKKKFHQDYKRTCDLAILYSQIITGIDLDKLLKQFVQRETEQMFQQRVTITEHVTPAMAATLMSPWYKIPRVNPVVRKVDFESAKEDDQRVAELKDYMAHFFGEQSLEDYLAQRYIDLNGTDPNAFIRVAFDPFDNNKEKANPYPDEISSQEAINYKYKNNELLWLITQHEIEYLKISSQTMAEPTYEKGSRYIIYTFDQAIRFTQVDVGTVQSIEEGTMKVVIPQGQKDSVTYYLIDKERLFIVDVFQHNAGMVPAFRVGVKPDLSTRGRTFVNMFHPAIPYFKKTLKTVSEMDLTMALHAFPQKISYQPKCPGLNKDNPCDEGKLPDQKTNCSLCKGTGLVVTTTTQDFITFRMPKKPDDVFDLARLVHYVNMPIDMPKFQNDYIDQLERKAIKAVYNSETIVNDTVVKTATEKFIDLDSVYDTLQPLAQGWSNAFKKTVRLTAIFTDNGKGLIVEHLLPKDMKMKTLAQNLTELKLAVDSGASAAIKQEIQTDIMAAYFVDRKDELKKLQVKQIFNPAEGKTETEIQFIISNRLWKREDMVLYAEFKSIFQDLEEDQRKTDADVWFYDLALEKQTQLVKAKVLAYVELLDKEKPEVVPAPFNLGG